jgi:N-acetylglucosamine-6-sulfatase
VPYTPSATFANTPENNAGEPRRARDQRNSWQGADFPYHSDLDIGQYYKRYCETLLGVDDSVGHVLQQLKDMGIYEDTLVIYMGDNGLFFGEHGLINKRNAYEESMRVPMLMQCPVLYPGGRVVEQVVANIDIAPTIFAAAGLVTPKTMDGLIFLPLAQGRPTPWRPNFLYVYYWEKNFPQTPTMFALRGDRYKYIAYYGLWDCDELYDLQADPTETRNLINSPEHRAIALDMEHKLYAQMAAEAGMLIPLNAPTGMMSNKRLAPRGGAHAVDFPAEMVAQAPHGATAR